MDSVKKETREIQTITIFFLVEQSFHVRRGCSMALLQNHGPNLFTGGLRIS